MFNINSFYTYTFNLFKLVLLKKKLTFIFYSYTEEYVVKMSYIGLCMSNLRFFFSKQMKTLIIDKWRLTTVRVAVYNALFKFWKQFFILTFAKIKYKGKGYKLYLKKKNRIFLQFGLSHKTYTNDVNSHFFFLMKGKLLFLGLNKKKFNDFLYKLIRLKYINIFTIRGLRLSRQVIFKKTGKISTYR